MDMLKPELHVVEQIRRDKYRVEQMNDLSNNIWDHQQNIRNPNNFGLIGILQDQILVRGLIDPYQDCTTTFMNMPPPQSMHRVDPQGSSNWRRTDHTSLPSNVGGLFSNHFSPRIHTLDCPLYTIDQPSMTTRSEISCMVNNREGRVTVLGQTNLQNVVTLACSGTDNEFSKSGYDQGSSSGSYRGEFMFLPSLGNQSVTHNASQWNDESSFKEPLNFTATSHTNTKGFSLSLSLEIPKLSEFRDDGKAAVSSTVNVHRHFGTAIFEHLKQLSSQYSSSGGDNNRFQKQQRSLIGNNVRFVESQHHNIWRPQRGLPERAVAVLRAWLFDHFLHPYPADSGKQMLAIQTGLSRNQVSNWFINSRVRLWKPMVEEMNMLDTKTIKNADTTSQMELSNRLNIVSSSSHEQTLMDIPGIKRSRLEYVCDNHMMGYIKGMGNVSLTLGLRHGVDNVTQTQYHQFGAGDHMFS